MPFATVMLSFGAGDNLIAGHFRIYATEGTDDGHFLAQNVRSALSVPAPERTPLQTEAVRQAFAAESDATALLRSQIANLEQRLDVLTATHSTMVMDLTPEPRETFILNRG